jgi:hypothetical protein
MTKIIKIENCGECEWISLQDPLGAQIRICSHPDLYGNIVHRKGIDPNCPLEDLPPSQPAVQGDETP